MGAVAFLPFAICDLRFAICDLRFAICDYRNTHRVLANINDATRFRRFHKSHLPQSQHARGAPHVVDQFLNTQLQMDSTL